MGYLLRSGDPRAERTFDTISRYVGYGAAHHADFYSLRQVLIIGRMTSGDGGGIILN